MLKSEVVKFWYRPNILAILALIILSLPATKSLAIPAFYTSHDGETHVARIAQYWQALADRQIPPRFAPSLYNGLGSPILTYIYPLPYLAASAIHSLGFSFTDSFEIIMFLGFVFSGIFSYLWLAEVFKSEKAAFVGALFYVFAPYRFLLIYVRASISEHLAYTFLPLVLYSLTKMARQKTIFWLAISSFLIALLMLSQNLVALMSAPLLGGYVLLQAIFEKSKKVLIQSLIVVIWGFAIASVTYLPSLLERKFIRLDEIINIAYPGHFVTLKQLIRSPWGYGFDLPGTVNDQMSFQIGLAHIFVFFISLALILFQLIRKNQKNQSKLAIYFSCIFILSIFLMLQNKSTSYVWQQIKLLHIIDIPWRFLGLATLCLSYLAAYSVKFLKPGFYFLFLVIFVLVANRNHTRINQAVSFNDDFFLNYTGTATQYDEFTPKWRQSTKAPIGFDPNIHVESQEGDVMIENVVAKSNKIAFTTYVFSDTAKIRINKFYFPGWNVQVDGKNLTPFKDLIITDTTTLALDKEQDSSGLMMVNLTGGNHQVLASFGETPLRSLANYLSLGSLILALGVIVQSLRRHV